MIFEVNETLRFCRFIRILMLAWESSWD